MIGIPPQLIPYILVGVIAWQFGSATVHGLKHAGKKAGAAIVHVLKKVPH
jgi:hypothetical protein